MIFFVDIDDTICYTNDSDYENAVPRLDRIETINKLYEKGNTIVYWTARGTVTGVNWKDKTEDQLKKWGVKYHEVRVGKPYYDLFICDKAINVKDWL